MRYCSITYCNNKHNAKNFCKSHYDRYLKFGNAEARLKGSSIHRVDCSITDCDGLYYANDLCCAHWTRLYKTGTTEPSKFIQDGKTKHPLYRTYRKILERCYNVSCAAYPDYGGRGIKVSDRWLGLYGFTNFTKDMGDRPKGNYSIDRIDNNKGYSKENCKWSTKSEQVNNRRPFKNSSTPYGGVYPYGKYSERWIVRVGINGIKYYVGIYEDLEEALSAKIGYVESK